MFLEMYANKLKKILIDSYQYGLKSPDDATRDTIALWLANYAERGKSREKLIREYVAIIQSLTK
jgi:GH25 family lysozyme M1 (1,4-beta-N-acetylmuramidase)